jgi:alcohol dehydrogenase
MKAAVLNAFGEALRIENLPDPSPGAGSVVIEVAAAGVAGYAANVFDGSRGYRLELPAVPGPGGIGRVRSVGPDATRLKPGDWVFCEPTVRARDEASDAILQGWTYRTDAALPLHRLYRDGSYAELMMVPTENVTRIGDIDAEDAGRWCGLSRLLVPYGGLLAGDLKAGETLLVSGATGGFGGAGVAVALAMGAGLVVATGRNARTLGELAGRLGSRVKPVVMTGDESADRTAITEAAGGPVDMVLDFLPREASLSQVHANLKAVRHGGRIILMGGVRAELGLDYNWLMHGEITLRGVWMYPPQAVPRMVQLVRAGLVDLHLFDLAEFALDEANVAVAYAAAKAGPRQLTVIRPNGR